MLLKFGVDISRLDDSIRRILPTVDDVYHKKANMEAVVTSTYEGTHKLNSLHYKNKAIDFRNPDVSLIPELVTALRMELGDDYDVVISSSCIHVEYDPK